MIDEYAQGDTVDGDAMDGDTTGGDNTDVNDMGTAAVGSDVLDGDAAQGTVGVQGVLYRGVSAGEGACDVDDFPGGLMACLEAVLMAADEPQSDENLARVLGVGVARVSQALQSLAASYDGTAPGSGFHGFELRHSARGWQFGSRAVFQPVVSSFVTDGQSAKLSQAALEALAIIAYQQPVTRARVAAIRGVNSDGVIRSLTARGLVLESGVDPDSRAALLVTSALFLDHMGLESLDDLPQLAPFMPRAGEVLDQAGVEVDPLAQGL